MAEVHRKIELQEQEDLRFLIANVLRVATSQIDTNLPPVEGEDTLRPQVQELVHEYITQTFTLASPNIAINGHSITPHQMQTLLSQSTNPNSSSTSDSSNAIEEYLPQDSKLIDRLNKLQAESDALTLEIAELRRSAPVKIREVYVEAWKTASERDDQAMRESLKDVDAEGEMVRREFEGIVKPLERQEDVERAWEGAIAGLGVLKKELGGTVAKMESARRAGEYVLRGG